MIIYRELSDDEADRSYVGYWQKLEEFEQV